MKKEMNKKAQFYILAVIIIVIVILSIAGITNYAETKKEPTGFYDLGESFGLEEAQIIDYGIYNSLTDINQKIDEFNSDFAEYVSSTGDEFELIVIYGNQEEICQKIYKRAPTGGVNTQIGGFQTQELEVSDPKCEAGRESIQIITEKTSYNIELKENENFLFIMTTSQGYEEYVFEKRG